MAVWLAYLGLSLLGFVAFHLLLRARWRRSRIQDLLGKDAANCRELLDLEGELKQAYQASGIPGVLKAWADLLTLLYAVGVVVAWMYLPTWYFALAATLLLPVLFTVLFYSTIEFAGPWWRFPAAYIQARLDCETSHEWDGCQCRDCRVSRNGGHRWNSSCQCEVCGQVRHQWNGTVCVHCGAKRAEAVPTESHAGEQKAAPGQVQAPLS